MPNCFRMANHSRVEGRCKPVFAWVNRYLEEIAGSGMLPAIKKKNKLKPTCAWHVVLALTLEKECANTEMKSIGCSQAIRRRCKSCC